MSREIILAKSAGYCFGVRRVVKMVEQAAGRGEHVRTLGPVIHNPRKIQEFEDRGIHVVDDAAAVREGTVVVRAHGITSEMLADAQTNGVRLVDGTCPYVTNSQTHAKDLHEQGYQVLIVGDAAHPEIVGIQSYIDQAGTVIPGPDQVPAYGPKDRVGVIAQTTLQRDVYSAVVRAVAEQALEVRAFNTICFETDDRQDAVRELAPQVDVLIVVGGRNSKNTEHLAQIGRELGTTTVKVESAAELDHALFDGVERIGITAGASTPDEQIEEIIAALQAFDV